MDQQKDRRGTDRRDTRPAQYELEAQAIREKNERLRALRLARDGDDRPAPAKARAVRKGGAPRRGPAAGSTLAEWLATQEDQGRRS